MDTYNYYIFLQDIVRHLHHGFVSSFSEYEKRLSASRPILPLQHENAIETQDFSAR
jgi:hypothetical protein